MAKDPNPRKTGVNALELIAGAPVPVTLNLKFRLSAEHAEEMEPLLGSTLFKTLAGQHETFRRWLGKSHANRLLYLTDPLAALRAAGLKLRQADLVVLRRLNRTVGSTDVLPAGIRIGSVSVELAKHRTKESAEVKGQERRARSDSDRREQPSRVKRRRRSAQ
jgi:hypothetical protein